MDGLMIGLDLNDDYTQICCYGKEKSQTIPTVTCRRKEEKVQLSGEEAYATTLLREGVIVDKLPKVAAKDGTSTIGGICYGGDTLLKLFIEKMLGYPGEESGTDEVTQLVITLQSMDYGLLDTLMHYVGYLEIPRDRVHVINHTKGFIYCVLSQKKELWTDQVGLPRLSGEHLCCYEMKVQRGVQRNTVQAEAQNQEGAFSLDVLDSPSGSHLADKMLTACGKKLLNRKLFSTVFLTGKGFKRQGWAGGFVRLICNRRRVFVESYLFARGAAYRGADYAHQGTSYPYISAYEGRLKAGVSLRVIYKGWEDQLMVASYGDNWYESRSSTDLIVDGQKKIEFTIGPLGSKKKRLVRVPLTEFPGRPPETTRVELKVAFIDEGTVTISIRGKGLRELFPSSGAVVKQGVKL